MGRERDCDSNYNWRALYSHKKINAGTGGLKNKRTSGDHPNNSIVENTKKSPEDLRRLAVIQTPVENRQLTLLWNTLNE